MKQRKLEIILEQAKVFESPSAELEQYYTPATVAARLLHFAFLRGDIASKRVVDLGCGTGVLALGAALLGGVVDRRRFRRSSARDRPSKRQVARCKSSLADKVT